LEDPCLWVETNNTTPSLLCSNAEITLGFLTIISRMYGAVHAGEGVPFGSSHHYGRVLAVEGPRNSVVEGTDPTPKNVSETLPAIQT
jgi:hypothetical protein